MSRKVSGLAARMPMSLVLALSLLMLTGCGQKGPLYMPGDSDSSETYDPQGGHEEAQPVSSKQAPGQGSPDAQRRQLTSPQASPAPAATQPSAEALP